MGRVREETQHSWPSPQPQPQPQGIYHAPQPYRPPQQLYNHDQPNSLFPVSINNNNSPRQVSNNAVCVNQEYQQPISPILQMPQSVGVPLDTTFNNTAAIGIPQQGPAVSPLQVNKNSSNNMDMMGAWTTGLFDCMDDPPNALVTATFPCVTFGQIADVLDEGHTTCVTSGIVYAATPCLVSRPYRKKLRERFGLVEAPSSDWIVHSVYEPCALCQEYRELTNRGIEPALGYHGNLKQEAEKNKTPMVPPGNQMMMN